MSLHRSFTISLLILLLSYNPFAALVNRTIDDEFGDSVTGEKLTYHPSDAATWKQGRNCSGCIVGLDPSLVWRGTWHDCTQHNDDPEVRSITAHFNGTAVYVYNVIASYHYPYPSFHNLTVTYLTFEIDGREIGHFFSDTDGDKRYGVQVFAHEGLPDGPHTLVIRTPPGPTDQDWSFTLFDYIKYTTHDGDAAPPTSGTTLPSDTDTSTRTPPSPSSSESSHTSSEVSPTASDAHSTSSDAHSTSSEPPPISTELPPAPNEATHASTAHTGAIAGGTVGAVAALVLGGFLVFLRRRNWAHAHRHIPVLPHMEATAPAATGNRGASVAEAARVHALEEELAHMRGLLEPPPGYDAAVIRRSSCALDYDRSV